MAPGIRVDLRVAATETCPVTRVATDLGATARSVDRAWEGDDRETIEFVVDAAPPLSGFEHVFTYGSSHAYRLHRSIDEEWPYAIVEQFGCPVVDARAGAGDLHLAFHVADIHDLRAVVDALKAVGDCAVERLLRHSGPDADGDLVFFDRASLTDRQLEVFRTAHERGYFEYPRGANATEVAADLDISRSTFVEHLAAVERKLADAVLEDGIE